MTRLNAEGDKGFSLLLTIYSKVLAFGPSQRATSGGVFVQTFKIVCYTYIYSSPKVKHICFQKGRRNVWLNESQ